MTGKQVLITGGTAGIGKAAGLGLARLGAAVTVLGRNRDRCNAAARELTVASGVTSADGIVCDVSSMASVREAVEQYEARHTELSALILNAGAFLPRRELSVDGFEKTFATRFLGHFLLVQQLLPLLEATGKARILVTGARPTGLRMDWDDVTLEKGYSVAKAQVQGTAALLMFALGLAKRLEGKGVTVNFMHPGWVNTDLFTQMPWIVRTFMRLVGIPPEKGADTLIYLASDPAVQDVTGAYFYKRRSRPFRGAIADPANQSKAWEVGVRMTGLTTSA
jgi:NAD(P)-dependent dehydrogenase (short-subunit alcohol dehydrogenase family)